MIAYIVGVLYATTIALQFTALAAVLALLGVFSWIGYTMFTAPSDPTAVDEQLDDLRPETINAKPEQSRTNPKFSRIVDVSIGDGTTVRDHVNLYGCKIGKNCKIESCGFVREGVTVKSKVFSDRPCLSHQQSRAPWRFRGQSFWCERGELGKILVKSGARRH